MPWTPDPAYADASPSQQALYCLSDLLAVTREQLDPRRRAVFLDIAICRMTAEWRLALDEAEDDPRGEAA